MSHKEDSKPPQGRPSPDDTSMDSPERDPIESAANRRKVLKAGLVAIPTIATLNAKPVRAATGMGSLGAYDYGDDGWNDEKGKGEPKKDKKSSLDEDPLF